MMVDENVYTVVAITSEYEVVINAGLKDDIMYETEFDIFVQGKEIFDPSSGESLGTLDIVKETVKAINVFPNMCRCRAYTTEIRPIGPFSMYERLNGEREVEVPHKLNINYDDISPNIAVDKIIKVGDSARIRSY